MIGIRIAIISIATIVLENSMKVTKIRATRKKKMGGRKNDKMITQPLCTKLLSTKKHEQLKLETNILQER